MASPDDRLHIFIVVGEPSGDVLGARLMAALSRANPGEIKYSGVGGPLMEAQGLESLFDYRQLAVMGLLEVLPQAPRLLRRIRDVAGAVEAEQPDAIITIDAPSFGFAVLKRLKSHNQPRIHYVAPQVWAWRPKRAAKIKKYVDHVLALLPFEAPYFDAAGMPCTFVGHSILEHVASAEDGKAFRARHGIAEDALVLCALPGSRRNEVRKLKPVIADVISRVAKRHSNLHVVIPTVSTVVHDVCDLASTGVPTTIIDDADEKSAAMAASDAAIAASGTATLELVCANVPTVVIYKVALITGWLGRYLANVKYASIANILADRELLPEFLQEYCKPKDVTAALLELIEDDTRRREVIDGEIDIVRQLTFDGQAPSEKAADEVLRLINEFKHR
ncbi:MAG: lipid-A-disaccharide synthase [Alphaproteobacteria bacterium]|nr:lipid-A-disaccharide synthase [Alphaproteobacteria bacterium]